MSEKFAYDFDPAVVGPLLSAMAPLEGEPLTIEILPGDGVISNVSIQFPPEYEQRVYDFLAGFDRRDEKH